MDIVGDRRDLTQFGDESIEEIYASHVLEHVPFPQIPDTLTETRRGKPLALAMGFERRP